MNRTRFTFTALAAAAVLAGCASTPSTPPECAR
jgi:predicted component of type VI protein secretion system